MIEFLGLMALVAIAASAVVAVPVLGEIAVALRRIANAQEARNG